ncbi:MAG TPA: hypothetical protein VNI84_15405 [Pyrinomonadaceae bacterium]|nr:hypothetical protein [Pyrinomonadaceae bacterium]
MREVELKFEREDVIGIVPPDTYLFDAARRLGVEVECERRGESDDCAMRVKKGAEFLSELTEREKEHLTAKRLKGGERLACQVKLEKPGEIVIMTHEKKVEEKPKEEVQTEEYRKQFEELPLEKKIASLLELEGIALSETFSFVLNSPSHIVGKFMDVLAEFGLKLEEDDKKAKRPKEHRTGDDATESESAEGDAPVSSAKGDNGGKPKRQTKKSASAKRDADDNQE